jgi:hypothetical protein
VAQLEAVCDRADGDGTEVKYRLGLSPELICPSPPLGRGHACAYQFHRMLGGSSDGPSEDRTPLVKALALHGVSWPEKQAGSHLGSTLKPGGAVLTRGVFRRSGSVAYVRADASPNEVLAGSIVPEDGGRVNSIATRACRPGADARLVDSAAMPAALRPGWIPREYACTAGAFNVYPPKPAPPQHQRRRPPRNARRVSVPQVDGFGGVAPRRHP